MAWEYVAFLLVVAFAPCSLVASIYVLWHAKRFWPLILVYGAWLAYSWRFPFNACGMCKQRWLTRLLRPVKRYFPCSIEGRFKSEPAVYLCYPHGVFSWGTLINFAFTDLTSSVSATALPDLKVLTLNANLLIPVWREFLLALGMASVGRPTIDRLLSGKQVSMALVLGGAREAALARPLCPRIILTPRRGIFELALRHGIPLVPVFSFGELEVVQAHLLPSVVSNALYRLTGYMFVLPGLPRRTPLVTVIGESVPTAHPIANPTDDDIAELRSRFRHALLRLYADNYARFGYSSQLEII